MPICVDPVAILRDPVAILCRSYAILWRSSRSWRTSTSRRSWRTSTCPASSRFAPAFNRVCAASRAVPKRVPSETRHAWARQPWHAHAWARAAPGQLRHAWGRGGTPADGTMRLACDKRSLSHTQKRRCARRVVGVPFPWWVRGHNGFGVPFPGAVRGRLL